MGVEDDVVQSKEAAHTKHDLVLLLWGEERGRGDGGREGKEGGTVGKRRGMIGLERFCIVKSVNKMLGS